MVQQYDINWSNLIRGKEALAHIKTKIKKQDFIPNIRLDINPCKKTVNINIFVSYNIKPEFTSK